MSNLNLNIHPSSSISVQLSRAVVGVEQTGGVFTEQEKTSLLANVANLQTGLANISVPNLAPINSRISNVEAGLAGITIPNIAPLTTRVTQLETSVGGITIPNLTPLTERVTTVENTVVDVQTKNTQQDDDISSLRSEVSQAISTVTGLQAALDGKASLVGGKLDPSQVPDVALQQYLGAVASEAAMLALADGGMYHAPHFVENMNIKLERGLKDTYNYGPETEFWYWFETSDQAVQFFTQGATTNGTTE